MLWPHEHLGGVVPRAAAKAVRRSSAASRELLHAEHGLTFQGRGGPIHRVPLEVPPSFSARGASEKRRCCDGKGVCQAGAPVWNDEPEEFSVTAGCQEGSRPSFVQGRRVFISACWEKGGATFLLSWHRRVQHRWPSGLERRRTLRDAGCCERALPAMSWRNSKAFHTLQTRMLMLMSAALVGALGVIIIAKDRGEFGMLRHTPSQFAQAARHSLMRHSRVVHARSSTRHSSHWVGSE